jgi:hypothetical protein
MWMSRRIMCIGRQSIALDRLFAGLRHRALGSGSDFVTFINIGVNLRHDQGLDAAADELWRFSHSESGRAGGGVAHRL